MLQTEYFASANTVDGFKSYFDHIFDPEKLNKIFIIKGGPGTGKSSLMRHLATRAQEHGEQIEYFLCSSDPTSLDGVYLRKRNIAVIDGTAPHLSDPIYPGVVEEVFSTSDFWNTSTLVKSKALIMENMKEKKKQYRRAYYFLNAIGQILQDVHKIGAGALNKMKMIESIKRIEKRYFMNMRPGIEEVKLIAGINKNGYTKLPTFENMCRTVFVIEDVLTTAYCFLDEIYRMATKKGISVIKSYSPLMKERINAICLPDISLCFVIGVRDYDREIAGKTYHYVNMKRFVDKAEISAARQKARFASKCCDMLFDGAVTSFCEAAQCHEKLEGIYKNAMDFATLTKKGFLLCDEILKS